MFHLVLSGEINQRMVEENDWYLPAEEFQVTVVVEEAKKSTEIRLREVLASKELGSVAVKQCLLDGMPDSY